MYLNIQNVGYFLNDPIFNIVGNLVPRAQRQVSIYPQVHIHMITRPHFP